MSTAEKRQLDTWILPALTLRSLYRSLYRYTTHPVQACTRGGYCSSRKVEESSDARAQGDARVGEERERVPVKNQGLSSITSVICWVHLQAD